MENVISNAERRAIRNDEKIVVPRISDVYAALPAITGKLELEYEGEMKGADHVGRELIRAAIAKTYDEYLHRRERAADRAVVRSGRRDSASDSVPAAEALENLKGIQGLVDKLGPLGVPEGQSGAAGFGGGVHPRRTACAQAHRPQRRARVQSGREEAGSGAGEIVRARRAAVPAEKAI